MMAKKQKSFKYLLASSAIASVVASLGSSNALAAGVDRGAVIINNATLGDGAANLNWNGIDNGGNPLDPVVSYNVVDVWNDLVNPKLAITYGAANHTLNANHAGATIKAINLANHQPGDLTVNQNLSIGSIVPDAHGVGVDGRLPIKIEADHTLTLTGTPAAAVDHGFNAVANTYTGLGTVTLGGAGSTLVVRSDDNGDIAVGNVSAGVHKQGVLTFATNGTVEQIGANDHRLLTVNIGDVVVRQGGAAIVTLNGNVYADNINFTRAGTVLKVGNTKIINGNIVARNNRRTLTFLGDGTVIGNIGTNNKRFDRIDINGATTLGGSVYTDDLHFGNAAGHTVTIGGHFKGKVTFDDANDGILTFNGAGGPYDFDSEIEHGDHGTLNVQTANLKATHQDIGKIKTINIGTAAVNGSLVIDAALGDVNLLGAANQTINFDHVDSKLILQNTANDNKTITFKANLDPDTLAPAASTKGIIEIQSVIVAKTLTIDGAALSLGTANHKLKKVIFSGDGNIDIVPTINAQNIELNVAELTSGGVVNGNILFNKATVFNANNNITGNVDFNGQAGTINLVADKTIDGNIIAGGVAGGAGVGTLNFAGIGTVTKDIGANNKRLARIDINGATTLGGSVYTDDLHFGNAAGHTVTIGGHFKGKVTFDDANDGILTFNGAGGPYDFDSEIEHGDHGTLNVQTANLKATHQDIGKIKTINIGTAAVNGSLVIDAALGDVNLLGAANQTINFDHADAQLTLKNSAAADKTITLVNNLNPGAGADGKGIVELHSVEDGRTLTIAGAGKHLGTAVNKLKEVIFSGRGKFDTRAIIIHSKNIELNVNELTLGDVNSNILFAKNTALTVGDITGNVDFQNHDGTVKLEAGKRITGSVTSTGTGDAKGTLEFRGIGAVTNPITNLKMLRAGAGNVRLVGGNHTITEIQGNGVGNLTFANNFNLTGSINSTGGNAVGLIFEGNNRVAGVVGTATSPVGTIQVQGTTIFGDKVQTANDKDIIISAGATAEFANSVTTRNIKGHAAGQGTVQFSNAETIAVNSAIGATNAVDTLDIAGADVKVTQAVSANNINFSNASKEATLTLERTSTVGGIRTNGNNVHTLALAADFTTGIQDIGLEKNRLKSIKLLGDHKITINSGVYYDVSTETNNTGKVIFNSDRSFAYNLGTNDLKLSDVIFDKNATVRGDVYSKQITIASDKTATFAGTINRTISVPNSTVDGASISRSLKSFAYSTQIGSDEIKNEGIAKFDKAVLVDAKITGGEVTFTDNVWFKQTANGKKVNFAADKFVILEQNINFANIKADKAKIIILPKTASITGNLAAKGLTVDIAANQLKYTGQAQLTGDVELVTAYDPSSAAGGNIEVQKGSKLDLSKADQLTIKVNAQTDINKIPEGGAKYVVISSVDGQGLVAIDNSKIKLDPTGEQNRFVQWSMDSSDLKLYITDISKQVIDKDIAGKSLSQEERKFYTLLNNVTDRNSSAGKFRNNIGLMDREHTLQAMDRILPGNENPIGESLARNPTSEIIRGLMAQADTQITATRMGNSVPMKNAASAVGSGDDDTLRYGVWGSPFYGTACQETYKGVSGYKEKSAGGIVGFDGLVNDNLLLGAAYSRINTQMSHQDKKFGDKTNGKTNIFSLYSLYNLTNNWFTEAIASYGITRVRNSEGRLIATNVKRNVTALETAAAKYKSISYSGQLLTGYNYIASEKLMITPTIGFRYSQFKDAGYTETGTKFQNLVVKKRSYNKFEGILGLRTAATLKANKVLLIPELHGYVNHDFKGKAPIIDARLDGINEPLPTKSVKPVKTFFTVGTGFTAKYNMMECGIIYNVNIASKYIGHQGSLKVKVNF
ncbi:autotransporter domain-containing protein [Candidatus Tisiphia endosymbiont of Piscicola geometra]|uniref:autotransporter domain-containing protein n=1 Tax=Candidatus Tisiphia endosymbiont of Piscicola geometra TaxID=3066273 RepID=UPI00312C9173